MPCPGCGITKSIVAIYEGAFLQSLLFHPFGIVAFSISATFLLARVTLTKVQMDSLYNQFFKNRKLTVAIALGMSIYHVIRLYFFLKANTVDDILQESIWR